MKKLLILLILFSLTGCGVKPQTISPTENKNIIVGGISLLTSYSEANYDSYLQQYTGNATKSSESFQTPNDGVSYTLTSVKFYLRKTGSPTGNMVAKLYAHTGTFGVSSNPTGVALATSNTIDVSTLTTSFALVEFTFSDNYSMSPNTYYEIAYEHAGTNSTNTSWVGADTTSPTYTGNLSYYTSVWNALNVWDMIFYIYGDAPSASTPPTDSGIFFDN